MTKSELVSAVAASTKQTKGVVEALLSATLEAMSGALERGEKVQILPFGIFSIAERSARQGRNPRTGEEITIAARKAIKFRASSGLAKAVANGGGPVAEEPPKAEAPAKPAGKVKPAMK
jgi:DNA-binding protein HU-beta